MQPSKTILNFLNKHANSERYLFRLHELQAMLPDHNSEASKAVIARLHDTDELLRICKGLYVYKRKIPPSGLLLFHAAAALRPNNFNYISLESVLSETGVISQIMFNWITIMSSGRSNKINCGKFGTIEFVHTAQKPSAVGANLFYDSDRRLWRANVQQAIKDMKLTKRNLDLIDWEEANEHF